MEGLIPFVYRKVKRYKRNKHVPVGSWRNESPSWSYMKRRDTKMKGLIPFVYGAVKQYKSRKDVPISSWFNESPSCPYMKLLGDSGRFQGSGSSLFGSEYGFSASSLSATSSAAHVAISSGVQSPICRKTLRRFSP